MYETRGAIKLINDIQTYPSGFSKREFVVTTSDSKYPQDLKFEVVKDKCAMLDSFSPGQEVVVNFDVRGNEYNGKYYVNLSCWKLQASDAAAPPASTPTSSEPAVSDFRNDSDFDDDSIPF
jgi:hypothetical protein